MAHTHNHHHHAVASYDRTFAIGIGLNFGFVLLELGYGLSAHSLALIADAGHNMSDVLALVLAWAALALSRRPASRRFTYGLRKTSVWAALVNALLLFATLGAILWESVRRLASPEPAAGATMIIVAAVGIGVNAFTAWLFARGGSRDLNIRGAFQHLAADALISLGVVLTGGVLLLTGWQWLDPLVSIGLVAIIGVGSWGLLRESIQMSLDAVPEGIDTRAIEDFLHTLPSVRDVHDLHVWAIGTSETALTAHLVVDPPQQGTVLLGTVGGALHDRFGIEHATLQIETLEIARSCQLTTCCVQEANS